MNTVFFEGIDYQYRPSSYWETADVLRAILSNVKGTKRRQMIKDYWDAGKIEELYDSHLLDSLSKDERQRLGRIHPTFMGGEYLPECELGEVEIARVELDSTTADVISVRAAPREGDHIYSVVDEYETEFRVSPESSVQPLSLEELIKLMDAAANGESLAVAYTNMNFDMTDGDIESLDSLRSFTCITSDFYPQLSLHYEKFVDCWYEGKKAKLNIGSA